jgi:hypothetical protein
MNNSTDNPLAASFSPTEIVECVKADIKANGLERALRDFEGMERILSRLPFWTVVKLESESLFVQERERLEALELARAKASATNVYQILPSAKAGVSNGPIFSNIVGQYIEHTDTIKTSNVQDYDKEN